MDAEGLKMLIAQRDFIKKVVQYPMKKGDAWYVLNKKWYEKWRNFVKFDDRYDDLEVDGELNPGPIDNSMLLDSNENQLSSQFALEYDFVIVPEEAWECLWKYYGSVHKECDIFRREVVETKRGPQVAIHLYEFTLVKSDKSQSQTKHFGGMQMIKHLYDFIYEKFNIDNSATIRLLKQGDSYFGASQVIDLQKECLIEDSSLAKNQVLYFDVNVANSDWNYVTNAASTSTRASGRNGEQTFTSGLCGLSNLGNTCFMNSALQSMSNVQPLTEYFLNDKWKEDLNIKNPLGMSGEIAETYAALMKKMWGGRASFTVPRDFKIAVSKFAPQFSGFLQHDAQELLLFLLDGLHEDLNRIKKKPYVEINDSDGRPDKDVAKEAWKNYKLRNDSVIVDLFHGLLKSHVSCPDCHFISVTFDPFSCLSLPLPDRSTIHVSLWFVPAPFSKPEDESCSSIRLCVAVPRHGTMKDVANAVGKLMNVNDSEIYMTEIYEHKVYKFFASNNRINDIQPRDLLYFYHIPDLANQCNNLRICTVIQRDGNKNCGVPLHIMVDLRNVTYDAIASKIVRILIRFVELNKVMLDVDTGEVLPQHDDLDSSLHGSDGETTTDRDDKMEVQNRDATMLNLSMDFNITYSPQNNYNVKPSALNPGDEIHNLGSMSNIVFHLEWAGKSRCQIGKYEQCVTEHKSTRLHADQRIHTVDLKDCFEKFTQEERLEQDNTWYCKHCEKHKEAKKKFDLWRLPQILIIHLKRFSYSRYHREKKESMVKYPIENLDITKFTLNDENCVYDLVSVSNHMGGMRSGHYTAYAKNFVNNNWYSFDDSHVSLVPPNRVVDDNAYVLVYKRRTPVNLDSMLSRNSFNSDGTADSCEMNGKANGSGKVDMLSPE